MSHESTTDTQISEGQENPDREYSNEEILEMLRRCKEKHGKVTPRVFRDDPEFCSPSLAARRFDSWVNAKKEAGVYEDLSSETGRERKYTDEQILSHLREAMRREKKKGKDVLTTGALQSYDDLVVPSVVTERFGKWVDAKKKAGIDGDARKGNSRPREYTNEELLEMIRHVKEEEGRVSQRIFDQYDGKVNGKDVPSAGAVRKRFGSWSTAKQKAGVEEEVEEPQKQKKYSDEELLEMLRECAEEHGGKCTAKAFADGPWCSPETIQRRFETWNEAKKEAGIIEVSN